MKRREFVKAGAVLGAAAALPKFSFAQMGGGKKLKVGLIGSGGRGCGAVVNALESSKDIEIVAVADLYKDKAEKAVERIITGAKKIKGREEEMTERVKVLANQVFWGWDCADKLLKCDVDIVIEATPPYYRPYNARKIIEAGKHAFLEKPAGVDATQMHEMIKIAKLADEKGLCIVCGTQRHYDPRYVEGIKRMQDGALGDVLAAQVYWNSGGYVGHAQLDNAPQFVKDLPVDSMEYQIRNWFSFIWASGDHIVEQHVHNIDIAMWGLGYDKLPVDVNGLGGRGTDLPTPKYGDRWSHFAVDFDMGNGVRIESYCRQEPGTMGMVGERFVGTNGVLEYMGGAKITARKGKVVWSMDPPKVSPYVEEHAVLIDCVMNNKKINDLHNLIVSNTVGIAGRLSAFSGKRFKYDWVMAKSKENLVPEDLTAEKMPLTGVPVPGKYPLV